MLGHLGFAGVLGLFAAISIGYAIQEAWTLVKDRAWKDWPWPVLYMALAIWALVMAYSAYEASL